MKTLLVRFCVSKGVYNLKDSPNIFFENIDFRKLAAFQNFIFNYTNSEHENNKKLEYQKNIVE